LIMKDINLEIFSGDFVWLQGGTGSGKTLALETFALKRHPSKGNVTCFDRFPLCRADGTILESETVKKNLLVALRDDHLYDATFRISEMLKAAGLFGKRNEKAGNLSAGEKQMLRLATFLILEPELIFFDEPFAFLDEEKKNAFLSVCAEKTIREKSVFIASSLPAQENIPAAARKLIIRNRQIYEK
ncbi:MAG: ATP-binding cassette domain-containing protein, partial [Elusimicrobia bacterium]|nr:ATP-binding cassette domain-containing protein [Elusimicrobiota bacterium]